MIDAARARVYAAEHQVRRLFDSAETHGVRTVHTFGSSLTLPVERRFASVESVQTYVDAVLGLSWVRADYPGAATPVAVRARRGRGKAHYEPLPPTIAVPLHDGDGAWALRELVVLHEIAHHLAADDVGHGARFVGCFTALVSEIVGPEAGLVLRGALHEAGAIG